MDVLSLKKRTYEYLFILPALFLVIAVTLYPTFFAFYASLHQSDYAIIKEFVGFRNFLRFITEPEGWTNILISLQYVFGSVSISFVIGLFLAVYINQSFPLRNLIRTKFD
jgi:multiple sugar transport system permease protein